jgi:excisionase family DNA binding protein
VRAEERAREVNSSFAGGLVTFDADRLLEAREVAAMLGVPISWVRRESREGDMPCLRLGRYVRYDRAAVIDWLVEQRSGRWRTHKPNGGTR